MAYDDLGRESDAIHCLCLIGLKTWPQLDEREKEFWWMSAGNIKGMDCRDDRERCYSITETAMGNILWKRISSLKLPKNSSGSEVSPRSIGSGKTDFEPAHQQAFQKTQKILVKHFRENPISAAEIEAAVAEVSVGANQKDQWIIAISSDLAQEEAELLMGEVYRQHRLKRDKAQGAGKQRPRPKQWLDLISGFENAETSSGGGNARGFNPYRIVIDGIRFTPRHPPVSS